MGVEAVAGKIKSILQDVNQTPLQRILSMRSYLASVDPGFIKSEDLQVKNAPGHSDVLNRLKRRLGD